LNARLSIGFACVGHTLMHLLTALFLTIVLTLEEVWARPYAELIGLWTLGSLLIGVAAPAAGWLGDRFGEARMMAVFFWLTGAGAVWAAMADGPERLWIALAVLGLGAAIYHPVGMSWVVRHAYNRGRVMGLLGVFGGLGVATAAITAASLTEAFGWRAAFWIPGAVSMAAGLLLTLAIAAGLVRDTRIDRRPDPPAARGDAVRAFIVLSVTLAAGGLIFNALQVGMPKWFEDTLSARLPGDGLIGIGGLVTLVYLLATLSQVVGGLLCDRFDMKRVYLGGLMMQGPLLLLCSVVGGLPMVGIAAAAVFVGNLLLPAENLLLARYTPARHRGLAYGLKFVLALGVAPLAVQLVAVLYGWTGGFAAILWTLAGTSALALAAASLLPAGGRRGEAPVAPAAAA
jgi:MFS family permease